MSNDGMSNGEWNEHRRLILFRFDAIDARLDRIETRLDRIETRQRLLDAKVYAMGGAAGVIGFALSLLFERLLAQ